MGKLGETLSTTNVEVEGEATQPLGGVLTTRNVRIDDGSYALLGSMLSTQELWGGGVTELGYWNPSRQPPIILPSALSHVSVTYGVGAWGNWKEVEAATAEDSVLAQVVATKVATVTCDWWLQIGVGSAGHEVPLAIVGKQAVISGTGALPLLLHSHRLPPVFVPSGSRLAVRGWVTGGHTMGKVFLVNLPSPAEWVTPWPDTYIEGGVVSAFDRFPSTPNTWLDIAADGATWTEVIAVVAADTIVEAGEFNCLQAKGGVFGTVLQLAVGAIGAEVIIAAIPFPHIGVLAYNLDAVPTVRKALVLAGERLSARYVTDTGNATMQTALYLETLV